MAHLLLVDDDNDIVEAFGDLLRGEGHEVHSASTGEEGLVVLRASPLPDALVLDVDMPVLGGPGMAHKMLLHDAGGVMEPVQDGVGAVRAHTDASLGAERASTDEAANRVAVRSQRILDDLIERDRISADERLLKYRETADATLAVKRSTAPARDRLIVTERDVADDEKKAERVITDSILGGERRRADAAAKTDRQELQRDQGRLRHYRHDTDHQLSTERSGADESTATLDKMRSALTNAKSEQERRNDIFGMVTHDLRNP